MSTLNAIPARTLPEPIANVTTVLTPDERLRVDAAGEGLYRSIHRDSMADVMRDVREARASAVVLSVSYCERLSNEPVATMVREFPRVPTLALLTELGPRTPYTLLPPPTSSATMSISGSRKTAMVASTISVKL